MTDGAPRAARPGKRWLVACLGLLLAVVVYSDTLDPVVQTLGLAHAKLFTDSGSRVLVVDSLGSADAPSVQSVFDGEIWGRHAYRVDQILLPFLALTLALGGLCHLLARNVSACGSYFLQMRRGSALPPVSLWSALFLGGCFAAWSEEGPGSQPSFALLPFVLATLVTAVMSASPRPSAVGMGRAFAALSASRWFWLGYLTLSPNGLFRPDGLVESQPLLLSPSALVGCVGALALLHWAARAPRAVDFERFSGPTDGLRADYQRYSVFCVQELWLLMPAIIMAAVVSQLRADYLVPYLLLSAASAALMTWSVEDRATSRAGLGDQIVRWLARFATVGLVLALPLIGQLRPYFASFQLPVVSWLIAIGLAITCARPWTVAPDSTAVEEMPREPLPFTFSLQGALLGLFTLAILGVALRGGLPLPGRDAALMAAQSELARSFAHQARLVRVGGETLLVGCNLDVARLSLAAEIVSNHLPDDTTKVVSVRTRRWERAGLFFLAFTVAVFLVFPAYLLTFASPGMVSRPYFVFCSFIGGANGAFAIGSALGWFWLDPMPHLAAFLLSTSLGWLGLGYARAWLDDRVSALGPSAPGMPVVARNTVA